MTKFVLHGGRDKNHKLKTDYFEICRILIQGFNKPKILLVYFAKARELWEEKFSEDQTSFSKDVIGRECALEIASTDLKLFEEQIKNCDIIYVPGGSTLPLIESIRPLNNFGQLISGKVYFGSSAGAYLVSKYYYSVDRQRIEEGLGILPIKCFAHWDESQQKSLDELKNFSEELPVILLREGEYKIINS